MTREDTVRMALEARFFGADIRYQDSGELEAFAALVAAAERNKVATWMMEKGYATGHGDTIEEMLEELEWQIRESEREACAKLCEAGKHSEYDGHAECAAAIRSRSNA